jgi:peptidoglycan hydrolase-like protein with peptidoglycan-binding domain
VGSKCMHNTKLSRTVVAAALFVAAQLGPLAQEPGKVPARIKQESKLPGGINVHGRWVIKIRNPDGKLVRTDTFENSLRPAGADFLAKLLSRQTNIQEWEIWVGTTAGNYYCGEPGSFGAQIKTNNLAVTSPMPGTLILTGSVTVSANGQLGDLGTQVTDVRPPNDYNTYKDFSYRDLTVPVPPDTTPPAPIQVQSNQKVDITVTFTFS